MKKSTTQRLRDEYEPENFYEDYPDYVYNDYLDTAKRENSLKLKAKYEKFVEKRKIEEDDDGFRF
ncbi:MAG: hypothetical protein ACI4T1_03380 [Christensenellales bacterium]